MIRLVKGLVWLAVLSVALAASGQQDTVAAVRECASVSDEAARLNCFDELARSLGSAPNEGNDEDTGQWEVASETNPLDDTTSVNVGMRASSGQSSMRRPIYLILGCRSNETVAYIVWSDYLSEDRQPVTWRIGDGEQQTGRWPVSTNNTATFVPGNAQQFIEQLLPETRFVAQTQPYNESPVTAVFELDGIANAIKPLREACGW